MRQFNENFFKPIEVSSNMTTPELKIKEINAPETLATIREALWAMCSKYTSNPELEALDAKLETLYLLCEEEERTSFDNRDSFSYTEEEYFNEVSHFNCLHETDLTQAEFESLKNYAKTNMITLADAICYAQACHNCNTFFRQEKDNLYGNLYCSEKCEKEIEVYERPCFYERISNCRNCDDVVCAMCSNTDKVALFNSRYNVSNFDEKKINETREYAKERCFTICESICYLSHCHRCGNTEKEYGQLYCNQRCCDYVESFNYPCIYGDNCKLCGNCAPQTDYMIGRLVATEDAGCLDSNEDILWIREITHVK